MSRYLRHFSPRFTVSTVTLCSASICVLVLTATVTCAQEQAGSGKALWDQAEGLRAADDNAGAFKVYNEIVAQFPNDNIYAPMGLYRMCMLRYNGQNITEALGCLR